MAGRPAARRYAQAVFQIALENDSLDRWSSDLDQIADALGDSDFFAFLEAPQVPEREKLQGIDTILAGVSDLARNLVGVLVDHRSVRFAVQVRDQFGALVDKHNGVARATVTTAVPLTDEQRGRVQELLRELVLQIFCGCGAPHLRTRMRLRRAKGETGFARPACPF